MSKEKGFRELFKATPVFPIIMQYHGNIITTEKDSFKEYIVDSRNSIKHRQKQLSDNIDDLIKSNPNDQQEIHEWYEEQHYHYNEFYPNTLNNSTFLSLYSFFEYNLKSICVSLNKYGSARVKPDDLSGRNYIEKAKKYLTLILELDLSSLEMSWIEITKFQQLRNCIVHNNSNIFKNKDQPIKNQPLFQIVDSNKYLDINLENGTISINDDQFLIDTAECYHDYLKSVLKKIKGI